MSDQKPEPRKLRVTGIKNVKRLSPTPETGAGDTWRPSRNDSRKLEFGTIAHAVREITIGEAADLLNAQAAKLREAEADAERLFQAISPCITRDDTGELYYLTRSNIRADIPNRRERSLRQALAAHNARKEAGGV